ncbi:unnamed protein product [Brassicogethes aeneus]|uniref:RNase H type-1 domain-containing protein n=1 Tax=Brassicogethes aeneus TaxID=1431903 RepID=A0A9P0BHB0_BRAAE|nr:unnamed protein product [Brassicogethes aeneus]
MITLFIYMSLKNNIRDAFEAYVFFDDDEEASEELYISRSIFNNEIKVPEIKKLLESNFGDQIQISLVALTTSTQPWPRQGPAGVATQVDGVHGPIHLLNVDVDGEVDGDVDVPIKKKFVHLSLDDEDIGSIHIFKQNDYVIYIYVVEGGEYNIRDAFEAYAFLDDDEEASEELYISRSIFNNEIKVPEIKKLLESNFGDQIQISLVVPRPQTQTFEPLQRARGRGRARALQGSPHKWMGYTIHLLNVDVDGDVDGDVDVPMNKDIVVSEVKRLLKENFGEIQISLVALTTSTRPWPRQGPAGVATQVDGVHGPIHLLNVDVDGDVDGDVDVPMKEKFVHLSLDDEDIGSIHIFKQNDYVIYIYVVEGGEYNIRDAFEAYAFLDDDEEASEELYISRSIFNNEIKVPEIKKLLESNFGDQIQISLVVPRPQTQTFEPLQRARGRGRARALQGSPHKWMGEKFVHLSLDDEDIGGEYNIRDAFEAYAFLDDDDEASEELYISRSIFNNEIKVPEIKKLLESNFEDQIQISLVVPRPQTQTFEPLQRARGRGRARALQGSPHKCMGEKFVHLSLDDEEIGGEYNIRDAFEAYAFLDDDDEASEELYISRSIFNNEIKVPEIKKLLESNFEDQIQISLVDDEKASEEIALSRAIFSKDIVVSEVKRLLKENFGEIQISLYLGLKRKRLSPYNEHAAVAAPGPCRGRHTSGWGTRPYPFIERGRGRPNKGKICSPNLDDEDIGGEYNIRDAFEAYAFLDDDDEASEELYISRSIFNNEIKVPEIKKLLESNFEDQIQISLVGGEYNIRDAFEAYAFLDDDEEASEELYISRSIFNNEIKVPEIKKLLESNFGDQIQISLVVEGEFNIRNAFEAYAFLEDDEKASEEIALSRAIFSKDIVVSEVKRLLKENFGEIQISLVVPRPQRKRLSPYNEHAAVAAPGPCRGRHTSGWGGEYNIRDAFEAYAFLDDDEEASEELYISRSIFNNEIKVPEIKKLLESNFGDQIQISLVVPRPQTQTFEPLQRARGRGRARALQGSPHKWMGEKFVHLSLDDEDIGGEYNIRDAFEAYAFLDDDDEASEELYISRSIFNNEIKVPEIKKLLESNFEDQIQISLVGGEYNIRDAFEAYAFLDDDEEASEELYISRSIFNNEIKVPEIKKLLESNFGDQIQISLVVEGEFNIRNAFEAYAFLEDDEKASEEIALSRAIFSKDIVVSEVKRLLKENFGEIQISLVVPRPQRKRLSPYNEHAAVAAPGPCRGRHTSGWVEGEFNIRNAFEAYAFLEDDEKASEEIALSRAIFSKDIVVSEVKRLLKENFGEIQISLVVPRPQRKRLSPYNEHAAVAAPGPCRGRHTSGWGGEYNIRDAFEAYAFLDDDEEASEELYISRSIFNNEIKVPEIKKLLESNFGDQIQISLVVPRPQTQTFEPLQRARGRGRARALQGSPHKWMGEKFVHLSLDDEDIGGEYNIRDAFEAYAFLDDDDKASEELYISRSIFNNEIKVPEIKKLLESNFEDQIQISLVGGEYNIRDAFEAYAFLDDDEEASEELYISRSIFNNEIKVPEIKKLLESNFGDQIQISLVVEGEFNIRNAFEAYAFLEDDEKASEEIALSRAIFSKDIVVSEVKRLLKENFGEIQISLYLGLKRKRLSPYNEHAAVAAPGPCRGRHTSGWGTRPYPFIERGRGRPNKGKICSPNLDDEDIGGEYNIRDAFEAYAFLDDDDEASEELYISRSIFNNEIKVPEIKKLLESNFEDQIQISLVGGEYNIRDAFEAYAFLDDDEEASEELYISRSIFNNEIKVPEIKKLLESNFGDQIQISLVALTTSTRPWPRQGPAGVATQVDGVHGPIHLLNVDVDGDVDVPMKEKFLNLNLEDEETGSIFVFKEEDFLPIYIYIYIYIVEGEFNIRNAFEAYVFLEDDEKASEEIALSRAIFSKDIVVSEVKRLLKENFGEIQISLVVPRPQRKRLSPYNEHAAVAAPGPCRGRHTSGWGGEYNIRDAFEAYAFLDDDEEASEELYISRSIFNNEIKVPEIKKLLESNFGDQIQISLVGGEYNIRDAFEAYAFLDDDEEASEELYISRSIFNNEIKVPEIKKLLESNFGDQIQISLVEDDEKASEEIALSRAIYSKDIVVSEVKRLLKENFGEIQISLYLGLKRKRLSPYNEHAAVAAPGPCRGRHTSGWGTRPYPFIERGRGRPNKGKICSPNLDDEDIGGEYNIRDAFEAYAFLDDDDEASEELYISRSIFNNEIKVPEIKKLLESNFEDQIQISLVGGEYNIRDAFEAYAFLDDDEEASEELYISRSIFNNEIKVPEIKKLLESNFGDQIQISLVVPRPQTQTFEPLQRARGRGRARALQGSPHKWMGEKFVHLSLDDEDIGGEYNIRDAFEAYAFFDDDDEASEELYISRSIFNNEIKVPEIKKLLESNFEDQIQISLVVPRPQTQTFEPLQRARGRGRARALQGSPHKWMGGEYNIRDAFEAYAFLDDDEEASEELYISRSIFNNEIKVPEIIKLLESNFGDQIQISLVVEGEFNIRNAFEAYAFLEDDEKASEEIALSRAIFSKDIVVSEVKRLLKENFGEIQISLVVPRPQTQTFEPLQRARGRGRARALQGSPHKWMGEKFVHLSLDDEDIGGEYNIRDAFEAYAFLDDDEEASEELYISRSIFNNEIKVPEIKKLLESNFGDQIQISLVVEGEFNIRNAFEAYAFLEDDEKASEEIALSRAIFSKDIVVSEVKRLLKENFGEIQISLYLGLKRKRLSPYNEHAAVAAPGPCRGRHTSGWGTRPYPFIERGRGRPNKYLGLKRKRLSPCNEHAAVAAPGPCRGCHTSGWVVVCAACKRNLYRSNLRKEQIKPIDFSQFRLTRSTSSRDKVCECHFCKIAKTFGKRAPLRQNVFSIKKIKTIKKKEAPSSDRRRCSVCYTLYGKGKRHICKSSDPVENIKNCVKSLETKQKEQIAALVLKDIVKNKNDLDHDKKNIALSQQKGGQKLNIYIGKQPNKVKKTLLSVEDFIKIKTSYNLSYKTTCGIASALRIATNNLKVIEPNMKLKLLDVNRRLDDYFSVNKFNFVKIKVNKVSDAAQTVVYCSDLEHIKTQRQNSDVHLKFGIDGGGGFLKSCLSLQSTSQIEADINRKSHRQFYKEGISSKKFKDSGVKKLFILGLAPCYQENYENVFQLWQQLKISSFSGTLATDLKLANIIVGIMSHSSLYPCTWCSAQKNCLNEIGTYKTIVNVLKNYINWKDAGADKATAKKFLSCVNPPLFETGTDKLMLDLIPPPELHLMLGVVNTVFNNMLQEFECLALKWAELCHVQREITHGSPAFKGNSWNQYAKPDWESRHYMMSDKSSGIARHNQIRRQLIPQSNVLLPPLHVNLVIVKSLIKAIVRLWPEMLQCLKKIFPKLSDAKLKEATLTQEDNNFLDNTSLTNLLPNEDPELRNLLNSWELGELYDQFGRCNISLRTLNITRPHHIHLLCPNVPLGTRILLEQHLFGWQKSIGTFCSSGDPFNLSHTSHANEENLQSNSQENNNASEHALEVIQLRHILLKSNEGKILLGISNQKGNLNDGQRQILVDRVVDFFIQENKTLNVPMGENLSNQILQLFPSEIKEYYHAAQKGKAPKGKLVAKFYNQQRKLKEVCFLPKGPKRRKTENNTKTAYNLSCIKWITKKEILSEIEELGYSDDEDGDKDLIDDLPTTSATCIRVGQYTINRTEAEALDKVDTEEKNEVDYEEEDIRTEVIQNEDEEDYEIENEDKTYETEERWSRQEIQSLEKEFGKEIGNKCYPSCEKVKKNYQDSTDRVATKRIYVDGKAGIGIRAIEDDRVTERSLRLTDGTTSTQAETEAVLYALDMARVNDTTTTNIYTDSRYVTDNIGMTTRCRNIKIIQIGKTLTNKPEIRVIWTRRDSTQIKRADYLATQAREREAIDIAVKPTKKKQ